VNRLLGEERVVVFDQPGTTRDSIYIRYERNEEVFTLIDTAGIRRRKNISEVVEKFSIVKTLKAVDDANVAVLVLDASEGIVEQDLHLLGHIVEAGRALVVAINKWDNLTDEHKQYVKRELERRLQFIDYAQIHFISALHGTGVGHLYESVRAAYRSATQKLQTHNLSQILERAVFDHAPPLVHGRRIKLRYAHAGGSNPPIIIIHGNQTDEVPRAYQKYLEKFFRRELELIGTPVRIEFRTGENPFADKAAAAERPVVRQRRLLATANTPANKLAAKNAEQAALRKPAKSKALKNKTMDAAGDDKAAAKKSVKRAPKAVAKSPVRRATKGAEHSGKGAGKSTAKSSANKSAAKKPLKKRS
jgi:GTP-binding protein